MLAPSFAFSGFSVDDLDRAAAFYRDALGLELADESEAMFRLRLPGGATVLVYLKPDHVPAAYTVLNFVVADVDEAVDELEAAGIALQNYGGYADSRGILRGKEANRGPNIAWFLDPARNVLSVLAN